ncbi:hypothetical protein Cfor_10580 [Coptotermes formosanus]|uniref:DUF6451 domain-containing protein n=1 Tax=Coptotermes formosanus TaxID=36987 RepID=A0A6L2QA46_COPFO|nr:hypothetical protein Cfor_10580 [Coptotermes formosanus]
MLETTDREAAKVGLKIDVNKSKDMRIASNNNEALCIHGETTERVTQLTYLGSIMESTGGTKADTTDRIRKPQTTFSALNKIWHSTAYSTETKLRIFNTNVNAVLLYGSRKSVCGCGGNTILHTSIFVFKTKSFIDVLCRTQAPRRK